MHLQVAPVAEDDLILGVPVVGLGLAAHRARVQLRRLPPHLRHLRRPRVVLDVERGPWLLGLLRLGGVLSLLRRRILAGGARGRVQGVGPVGRSLALLLPIPARLHDGRGHRVSRHGLGVAPLDGGGDLSRLFGPAQRLIRLSRLR